MPDDAIKAQIEAYLLKDGGWVPTFEICALFGVTERQLRQTADNPGLCTDFAISKDKHYRHVHCAAQGEWLHFKHRMRRHAIKEFVRVRNLNRSRHDATRLYKETAWEKDTGQAVMGLVITKGGRDEYGPSEDG